MTDTREHPPPATAPAAPMAATRPGLAGLPRQSRSVLGGLDGLRPGCGRHLHRAVRLLAGPRPGALRVAVQVDRDVRAPTGLAYPAALLGRARLQSGDDLVRARPARLAGAQWEVRRGERLPRAGRLLPGPQRGVLVCGQPQPGVLVDRY